jgi:hypothetical protein
MFNILPPLLIILGVTGLIYIFQYCQGKEKENIYNDLEIEKIENKKRKFLEKFYRIFNKKNYQKTGDCLFAFTEKVLVRSRIIVLRIDRTIFRNLTKIRIRKNIPEIEEGKQNGIIGVVSEDKLMGDNKDVSHLLDTIQEEKNLLKKLRTHPDDLAVLKNLARIYLWRKDFSSARWALLQAFRLDKEDNVVQDLLLELYEKRGGTR